MGGENRVGKYQESLRTDPRMKMDVDPVTNKMLINMLTQKATRMDAINEEDESKLNILYNNLIKKHQKGLSNLVMHTTVFKYYVLMYLGNVRGYFGARDDRTKAIDIELESLLRKEGYVAKEIAEIFASKWYSRHLEEFITAKSKKNTQKHMISAVSEAGDYLGGFVVDDALSELVEEWSEIQEQNELIPEKIPFLKRWLLS